MKFFAFILILFCSIPSLAQTSDFIILKKKDRTVASYFPGTKIQFVTRNGAYRDALIEKIEKDTLFIREYLVRKGMTSMGFYVIDTLGSYHYAYDYHEIHNIGTPDPKFNWSGSGSALFGGGILLTAASGVVYLADRKKFSPELMIAGAGLGIIGYLILKISGRPVIIGKRGYHLDYFSVQSNTNAKE